MTLEPMVWKPPINSIPQMEKFLNAVNKRFHKEFKSYSDLHRWSVESRKDFWGMWLNESGIRFSGCQEPVELPHSSQLGGRFFPAIRFNFAENLLRHRGNELALLSLGESRGPIRTTYAELFQQVGQLQSSFLKMGIQKGDRVAAILPNIGEAVVAMLAATSIGAIWSSCSPDFGTQGILDRFSQIKPKLLIVANGYRYGGKDFSCLSKIEEICNNLSSVENILLINDCPALPATLKTTSTVTAWGDALDTSCLDEPSFEDFKFNTPLYILYSSGTTGVPKCIVHGAGGTLLQHTKELMLHSDLKPGDTILYFTTCGWMMWNWLVSSLFTGATVVLYDGSPTYPEVDNLWSVVAEHGVTHFGTSPRYIGSCRKAFTPKNDYDLSRLRVVMSTGAPLLPEDFDWFYSSVSAQALLASISGGTDIISCFMLGNPMLPVFRGEIQAKGLGMDIAAFGPNQAPVFQEKGELVCRQPFPSMPVQFWNDPDDQKYTEAYFPTNEYSKSFCWCHGDYVEFTGTQGDCGGVIVHGRSDATLNPGGIRIGTAEIYRIVETLPWVRDSVAVGQSWQGDVRIILFIQLVDGFLLDNDRVRALKNMIRMQASPRHVPAKILPTDEIPYTRSGKKVEIAVRKILEGTEPDNINAISNPEALSCFRNRGELA